MNESNQPIVRTWLAERIPIEAQRILDRLAASDDVARIAIMPDVHAAAEVCVGTVVATTRLIYPAAVGGDIGCGMAAVAFDAAADLLSGESNAARLLNGLRSAVPANRHGKCQHLPARLTDSALSTSALERLKSRDASVQLGTLGRGNHFLEFQADEEDRLWLMVHSGSRAVGQAVRDLHVRDVPRSSTGLAVIDAETAVGQAYLSDATWARAYAATNRRAMVVAASDLMKSLFGVRVIDDTFLDCDHNHVQREAHFGTEFWVHRKGATPAANGQAGIIPGSMGTRSFHVEGRGDAESLRSSSHGAGRAMSRTEARRRIAPRELDRQMRGVWFDRRLSESLREESPAAYKDIGKVMRAQQDLTRIVRTLRPLLNYKGV